MVISNTEKQKYDSVGTNVIIRLYSQVTLLQRQAADLSTDLSSRCSFVLAVDPTAVSAVEGMAYDVEAGVSTFYSS